MIQDLLQSPPMLCDHVCLHWSFLCQENHLNLFSLENLYTYSNSDYSSMIKFINEIDWDNLLSDSSIEIN